ncbi:MAG: aspartate aminotransferase family protein [Eubacteriales bacterium]
MTNNNQIVTEGKKYVMNTYGRLPMALVKGKGTMVWDSEGKSYLDFVTGLAVTSLGHSHPEIVQVIKDQAEEMIHSSNLYWIPNQVALAKILVEKSFADQVFFCNSGAEANEGAIKLARIYARKKFGENKTNIISLKNSFHGRTMATLTATGQKKYQKYYDPLPQGFSYIEINNIDELEKAVNENTAALFIEPIQGEGGVYPVDRDYLLKAREICDKNNALLVFDEVQCGMGRTGKLFAHEWMGVTPDIMTLAKSLAAGVPIGAILAKGEIAEAFQPGDHASTFGGNYIATAVGCKVMEIITRTGFLEAVIKKSEYFKKGLVKIGEEFGVKGEIRGIGFMLGMPLGESAPKIVEICLKKGLLINCVGGKTLRFLPPLNVKKEEMDKALVIIREAFEEQRKQ